MTDEQYFKDPLHEFASDFVEFPISGKEYVSPSPGRPWPPTHSIDESFISHDSNDYFFVSEIENSTFTAGRNLFRINPSNLVKESITTKHIKVYDPDGNKLNVFDFVPNGSTTKYTEGSSQVFGVLVYPTTTSGVGRIEVSASALERITTSSIDLEDDERWPRGWYKNNNEEEKPFDILWVKAIFFAPNIPNKSDSHFFDFPSLTASTGVYQIRNRYGCGVRNVTGSCSAIAITPKHGDSADFNYNTTDVKYVVTDVGNTNFNSAMEGASIRFTNVSTHVSTINVDFVATIRKVLTNNTLLLDKPFVISNQILNGAYSEDVPYIEDTGTNIKRYEPFNEVGLYSDTTKSSGAQLLQSQQVYNIGFLGIGHKKNYTVTNIKLANYEIVYLPRTMESAKLNYEYVDECVEFGKKVCLANLQLTNLRTLSGAVDRYRILKKSRTTFESSHCIAEGRLEPRELVYDWFAGEDVAWIGRFYDNRTFAHAYWLTSSAVSYDISPATLTDSITIVSPGTGNAGETDYVILKNNRGENHRTSEYIQHSVQTGSWWNTSPKKFVNFDVEPRTSYECTDQSPYTGSIEVVKSGPMYNSNFIKLTKNTMYELSMDYANLSSTSTGFSFDVYFITTQNATTAKVKLGSLNSKTTRGYNSGTYKNKVFIPRTMYGTIQLVPKFISSIAVANISVKQFRDLAYSPDSAELVVPLSVQMKNEQIELTVELLDTNGKLIYGTDSSPFGNNMALKPLRDTVIADPAGLTITPYVKETLYSDETFYVRNDGDDRNVGTRNDPTGSFLTIQRAIDVAVGTLNSNQHDVIVRIGTGSFTSSVVLSSPLEGGGRLILSGSGRSIGYSSGSILETNLTESILAWNGRIEVSDLEFRGNGNYLSSTRKGEIVIGNGCVFSTTDKSHILSYFGGVIQTKPSASYEIVGGGQSHWKSVDSGYISVVSASVTLAGIPFFSRSFCEVSEKGVCQCIEDGFTGSAAGRRYIAESNGVIDTNGNSSSYLPGNLPGIVSGGLYL